jgi:hypothetical protein
MLELNANEYVIEASDVYLRVLPFIVMMRLTSDQSAILKLAIMFGVTVIAAAR